MKLEQRFYLLSLFLCIIICFFIIYIIKPQLLLNIGQGSNKKLVNVESFSKKWSEKDDTGRIQRAINYAKRNKSFVVIFDSKEYYISAPLKVYSHIKLLGQNKTKTKIISKGDIPAIASEGYFSPGVGSNNIEIENIGIYPREVTIKTKYDIELVNTYNSSVKNCYINDLAMSKSDVGGIRFSKDSKYNGNHFVNSVRECQLQNASVVMESTDSYIQSNEIWADTRSFGIHIIKSSQFITNNQIVGSNVNGGLWIEDTKDSYDVELIRITDNFFDGSYDNVDSGVGLYAKNLRLSNITGNNFWRLMDEGIKLTNSHSITIMANVFSDNNRRDAGKDDILLDSCSACVGVGNTFKRSLINQNKGSAIRTINSSENKNQFSANSIFSSSFYNPNSFSNLDIGSE
ncbi:right-handed parallel beta-helix repeat-containing protein [Neobacillus drentensis]|uniref:right-handed parallel beta-helix repeat-containing protein n=1 Tax=Neobacillus drentensis TaxID=220684 RepID=UPI0030032223